MQSPRVTARLARLVEADLAPNPAAAGERRATPLAAARVQAAKFSYTTRNVHTVLSAAEGDLSLLAGAGVCPRPGDLVLARVVEIGQHKRIELPDGRKATLFLDDEIIVAYAGRYAPDAFLAECPEDLRTCDLVAAGGIASEAVAWHVSMDLPTRIEPQGLVVNQRGDVVTLADFASIPWHPDPLPASPLVLAVSGTSMNAGKTTVVANVVRGLVLAGIKVGAAKVTGTGAGGDPWVMRDAGSLRVLDFTDCGYASTYHTPLAELNGIVGSVVHALAGEGAEVVVLEVADGMVQGETVALLSCAEFRDVVDGMLFTANEALGAADGVRRLREMGHLVLGVSGRLSTSPLAMVETRALLDVPVHDSFALSAPGCAVPIMEELRVARRRKAACFV